MVYIASLRRRPRRHSHFDDFKDIDISIKILNEQPKCCQVSNREAIKSINEQKKSFEYEQTHRNISHKATTDLVVPKNSNDFMKNNDDDLKIFIPTSLSISSYYSRSTRKLLAEVENICGKTKSSSAIENLGLLLPDKENVLQGGFPNITTDPQTKVHHAEKSTQCSAMLFSVGCDAMPEPNAVPYIANKITSSIETNSSNSIHDAPLITKDLTNHDCVKSEVEIYKKSIDKTPPKRNVKKCIPSDRSSNWLKTSSAELHNYKVFDNSIICKRETRKMRKMEKPWQKNMRLYKKPEQINSTTCQENELDRQLSGADKDKKNNTKVSTEIEALSPLSVPVKRKPTKHAKSLKGSVGKGPGTTIFVSPKPKIDEKAWRTNMKKTSAISTSSLPTLNVNKRKILSPSEKSQIQKFINNRRQMERTMKAMNERRILDDKNRIRHRLQILEAKRMHKYEYHENVPPKEKLKVENKIRQQEKLHKVLLGLTEGVLRRRQQCQPLISQSQSEMDITDRLRISSDRFVSNSSEPVISKDLNEPKFSNSIDQNKCDREERASRLSRFLSSHEKDLMYIEQSEHDIKVPSMPDILKSKLYVHKKDNDDECLNDKKGEEVSLSSLSSASIHDHKELNKKHSTAESISSIEDTEVSLPISVVNIDDRLTQSSPQFTTRATTASYPQTLHLRFKAELNHLESIQEAERQLTRINRVREVATMTNQENQGVSDQNNATATLNLQYTMLKREICEILSNKMELLLQQQQQADAKRKFIHTATQISAPDTTVTTSTYETGTTFYAPVSSGVSNSLSIPQDIISMMSKAESKIPEIMCFTEQADHSSFSIQKTISEAINERPRASSSSIPVIDEDLENELSTTDFSSKFEEDIGSRSTNQQIYSNGSVNTFSSNSSSLLKNSTSNDGNDSFTQFALDIVERQLEEENVRAGHQLVLLNVREKALIAAAKNDLQMLSNDGDGDKERKTRIVMRLKRNRSEIKRLRNSLTAADRERKLLISQRRRLVAAASAAKTSKRSIDIGDGINMLISRIKNDSGSEDCKTADNISSDVVDTTSLVNSMEQPRPNSKEIEEPVHKVVPKVMKNIRKCMGKSLLKSPLSPKQAQAASISLPMSRCRHASAESDDSITTTLSHVSSTEFSNDEVDVRVQALQEELKQRMIVASRLKKRSKRHDRVRAQEDSLKKQIEEFDRLIDETRLRLQQGLSSPAMASKQTPPQIKTPKIINSRSFSDSSDLSIETTSGLDQSSTETILLQSPHKGIVSVCAPNSCSDTLTVSKSMADEDTAPNTITEDINCYSDDFTLIPSDRLPHTADVDKICSKILIDSIDEACRLYSLYSNQQRLIDPMGVESTHSLVTPNTLECRNSRPNEDQAIVDICEFIENDVKSSTQIVDYNKSIEEESEHLRLQQFLIEQEIISIQKSVKFRDIPNKPPPPYSPRKEIHFSCSSKNNLLPLSRETIFSLTPIMLDALDTGYPSIITDEPEGPKKTYFEFLFDCIKHIKEDLYKCQTEIQNPPWIPQKPLIKQKMSLPQTNSDLVQYVNRKLLAVLNFTNPEQSRDTMLVRWLLRKRDHVDKILVRELYQEESQWTNFDREEAELKDDLSDEIFNFLIDDTVAEVLRIF